MQPLIFQPLWTDQLIVQLRKHLHFENIECSLSVTNHVLSLEMYQRCHPSRPPTTLAVIISLSDICIVEDIMRIYFEGKEFPYWYRSLEPRYTFY